MPTAARRPLTPLLALSLLATPLLAAVPPEAKVARATEVYEELLSAPDRGVPEKLLKQSSCIAIVPSVIKGAFGWGGRHGRGVLTCRNEAGAWSPPLFISLSGGSFGFQIGAEATDLVLFFTNKRGAESILKSKFTLGGDASVAAGPVGRTAQANTDLRFNAEIYSYARSRGLFAGLAIEGARLAPHQKSIARFYGRRIWPASVLFDHQVPVLPAEAKAFIAALP